MTSNTDFYYEPERDNQYISDYERRCTAVQEYYYVQDKDDLAGWRSKWFEECRICGRCNHCFPCLQMQSAKPEVLL